MLQAQAAGIPVNTLARGQALQEGRVTGRVLWPYENGLYPGMNPNRSSLVIYWELNGTSLLTTGDLHPDYAPYAYTGAQVLKVPHHGSRDDNSPAALGMVCPQIALITAPGLRPQLSGGSARLEAWAPGLLTGQAGAITLVFEQAGSPRLSALPGRIMDYQEFYDQLKTGKFQAHLFEGKRSMAIKRCRPAPGSLKAMALMNESVLTTRLTAS